ncbi:magnesium transporter [Methanolobus sp.]|uniref:magnesium transporter n=1 Tax=Methanolobus sp. TaxID=1874737 RepID=UPI0025E5BFF0|nr:magnesium transporter [Methanolobus sp.]
MTYYTVRGIVGRSFPIILFTSIIGILTGQLLNLRIENLIAMPIILLLIPALIKIGGDTGSMLGARLSSALHMGLGGSLRHSPVVRNSVIAAFIVGECAFTFLAVVVWMTGAILGIGLDLGTLMMLCLIAGTFELIIVFSSTVTVAFVSHRLGADPDDTVIPLIATLGDLIGVVGIFMTMNLLGFI